jgi:hypothetical protein
VLELVDLQPNRDVHFNIPFLITKPIPLFHFDDCRGGEFISSAGSSEGTWISIGKIAVAYVEWAGAAEQQVVVPWSVIDGPASADEFVQKLRAAPIRRAYRTSISEALKFSAGLFGTNYKGLRRVIDISGDGTNNQGDLIVPTRDDILRKGITINGLPILLKTPVASMIDLPDLDIYYQDCVIGGPGAFLVPVRERHQFADAIRNKLLLEVAGVRPRAIPLPPAWIEPAADNPRVSCTIGEQMWQRRWGGEGMR